MDKLFLQVINMSITSSYVVLFVLVLRFLLKRAAKIFSYGLWSIVFFRLVFPFNVESIFSLISINTKTIPGEILYTQSPQINSGIVAIDSVVNNYLPVAVAGSSINPMKIWILLGQTIWMLGIGILITYMIFTTLRLSKRLKSAKLLYSNIYVTNNIKTPFLFGVVNPKIYLPEGLSQAENPYIIKHEQTHIKRYDHIIKFLGFLVVVVHWFNPLVWVSFFLMSNDMELSCDESVIREMGNEIKKDYSSSLLSLSTGRRIVGSCPIAFGESNTKVRIKNILNYKKPRFWVTIIAIIVIMVTAVGLLSNPKDLSSNKTISEDSTKDLLNKLENQDFTIEGKSLNSEDDETIISFGKAFVNLYNGAVSEQEKVSFEKYIGNKNLLKFTDKILELTQKQAFQGGYSVIYGLENEFKQSKIQHVGDNLCYLELLFEFEGSGMGCKMLITTKNKSLKLVDLYFGNKDGVDTLSTGHPADRKIYDPNLWENEEWVKSVFDKLKLFEETLGE